MSFVEGLGVFVHEELDIRVVIRDIGSWHIIFYKKWMPIGLGIKAAGAPRHMIEAEWLYRRFVEFGTGNPEYQLGKHRTSSLDLYKT